MEISYDKTADALSIWFKDVKSEKTIDVTEDIFVDIDNKGRLAGIEVLHASQKMDLSDLLTVTLRLFPLDKELRIQVPDLIQV